MKKRILAVLLMVVILAALFAGLSVTAAAANDVSGDTISGYMVAYTMKNGDTVLNICKKLGIDFYKNQAMISKVNNIGDYSTLPVGKVLWLPATSVGSASDYYTLKSHKVVSGDDTNTLLSQYGIASTDAMLSKVNTNLASPVVGTTLTFPVYTGSSSNKMADNTTAVIGGTAAAATTATGIATGTGTVTPTSGSVAYYLVAYTMKQGDTVGAVCTSIGINFNQYSALISRINGITNYNRIPVGRVVLIPSGTATGTSYKVVAHQIQAGETANSICTSYGVNLASNLTLVKGLNNTNNLNYIQAGGILYVPVPGTSPTPGPEPTPTPTPGTAYKLSKDDCDNGSFILKVDGAEATSAAEGKTVTIVCNGAAGFAQKTITAHMTGDSAKIVKVTNNTFIMPDYNVTVNVTFDKAKYYAINASTAANGGFEFYVDDALVTNGKTYAGAAVTVKTKPNTGFVLDTISVFKSADHDITVPVTDGKFTMPDYKVDVEVTFKAASSYEYPLAAVTPVEHGSFQLKVNNAVVSKAASGKTVNVAYTAETDYKLDKITIYYKYYDKETSSIKTKDVVVSNAKFTMPTFDDEVPVLQRKVDVEVLFIKAKTYNIIIKTDAASTNTASARVNGVAVNKAEEGRTVLVLPVAYNQNYALTSFSYSYGSTTKTESSLDSKATFLMPAADVTITPVYTAVSDLAISKVITPDKGTVSFSVNAVSGVTKANPGDTVNMTITPNANYSLESVKVVYKWNGEEREIKVSGNNFTMPPYPVEVQVKLSQTRYAVVLDAASQTNSDISSVEFTVNGKSSFDKTVAAPGDNVIVNIETVDGKAVKKITGSYVDAAGDTQTFTVANKGSFVMPSGRTELSVETKEGNYKINLGAMVNGQFHVEKGGTTVDKANMDDTLKIVINPDMGYMVDTVEVKSGGSAISVSSDYKFKMPSGAVTVNVTFKGKVYTFTKGCANGSVKLEDADGKNISTVGAGVGETVHIAITPNDGYKVSTITVTTDTDNSLVPVNAENNFTMPNDDVTVKVKCVLIASVEVKKEFNPEHGSISLLVNGTEASFPATVHEEDKITVVATPGNGYLVDTITITYVKSGTVKTLSVTDPTFIMPDENVKVAVTFKLNTP